MLFFLNDNIQHNKSGIEHAQIKRLHLFEMFDEPAKIVTRKYSNELHMVTEEAGIADEDFVNLFDYFQEARIFPQKDVTIKDLNILAGNVKLTESTITTIGTVTGLCMSGDAMIRKSTSLTFSTLITLASC